MHVLLTTDSVGGVWNYTEELSAGLVRNGHRVTLVTFGQTLDDGQRAWLLSMDSPGFEWVETQYRLEWMENSAADVSESFELLRRLVLELQPDVLHSNQFAFGELSKVLPVLLTGHSDVFSWWRAVHGHSAPDTGRFRAYWALVRAGLQSATRLAAPTVWMARELREQYGINRPITVIANGRTPGLFSPELNAEQPRTLQCITAGRAWDPGKNVQLLEKISVPMPILVAGEAVSPDATFPAAAESRVATRHGVTYLGKKSAAELRDLYSRCMIYVATSLYEPFGLAPLEAALSGCALVLADLPTLREIWGDAALFYPARDVAALQTVLRELATAPEQIDDLAARALARARTRYTADAMVTQHEAVYASMVQAADVEDGVEAGLKV